MISSLIRMYKAGWFSRIYQEFSNFIYDLINGVETRKMVLGNINPDSNHNDYTTSHTKTVIKSLNFVEDTLLNLEPYDFIDIGCGKGKTLLLAENYPFKKIIGYEINNEIFDVLIKNINTKKSNRFVLHNSDLNFEDINDHSVLYFYNTFQEPLTAKFFKYLEDAHHLENIVLIYVNALYSDYLDNSSWELLYQDNVSTQDIKIYKKT